MRLETVDTRVRPQSQRARPGACAVQAARVGCSLCSDERCEQESGGGPGLRHDCVDSPDEHESAGDLQRRGGDGRRHESHDGVHHLEDGERLREVERLVDGLIESRCVAAVGQVADDEEQHVRPGRSGQHVVGQQIGRHQRADRLARGLDAGCSDRAGGGCGGGGSSGGRHDEGGQTAPEREDGDGADGQRQIRRADRQRQRSAQHQQQRCMAHIHAETAQPFIPLSLVARACGWSHARQHSASRRVKQTDADESCSRGRDGSGTKNAPMDAGHRTQS